MALKIFFMGTPKFSVPILESLCKTKHKILQVYTQPPKKKNRGQKIDITPVHDFSNQKKIQVRYPHKLDTEEELKFILENKPDVIVVVAYGKILPSKFLDLKDIKFINVHASLLPKWRGAAPIQRSIMNQDHETGISIMKIIPKLDAGPVMMKAKIAITKDTNLEKLSNELSRLGAKMLIEALKLIENKKDVFIDQNENEASYANKIEKMSSKINWKDKAEKVLAKINALNPNPGSWFYYNGIRHKIIKAMIVKEKGKPGEIINSKFTIACSQDAIQILELQKEGKKKMEVSEYLRGNKLIKGSNVNEIL